jgi:hypothetical protein
VRQSGAEADQPGLKGTEECQKNTWSVIGF